MEREAVEVSCLPSAGNAGMPIWASCSVQRAYDFSTDARISGLGTGLSPIALSLGGLSFSGDLQGAWFKAESKILQWVEDKSCSSHSTGTAGHVSIRFGGSIASWRWQREGVHLRLQHAVGELSDCFLRFLLLSKMEGWLCYSAPNYH